MSKTFRVSDLNAQAATIIVTSDSFDPLDTVLSGLGVVWSSSFVIQNQPHQVPPIDGCWQESWPLSATLLCRVSSVESVRMTLARAGYVEQPGFIRARL